MCRGCDLHSERMAAKTKDSPREKLWNITERIESTRKKELLRQQKEKGVFAMITNALSFK